MMPSWVSLCFQDSGSPSMSELFCLHDHIMVIMLLVIILVSYIMLFLVFSSFFYKYLSEGTFIETIWSIVPAFLLLILVVPSMKVLYLMEDIKLPSITVKVVAHQWYWSYIVPFLKGFNFSFDSFNFSYFSYDSIMEGNPLVQPRLLSCSSSLVLPINSTTRFLVSSTDVIHAFSVPSLGLKVDAVPGRVNQLYSNPSRLGLYFGQCSEICGSNHSFMPIELKISSIEDYNKISEGYLLDSIVDSCGVYLSLSFTF
uniref:Cytochrome c oxidase subunit 2 n=1 Tax=Histiostoma feroniarum TaxID=334618 RepID=A0A2Z4MAE7_9ACAR|nr:cytochrome c oxidase subunit II [Histiostoma feroniarum]AWX53519.1 cytochrome oxidase subunit 2 [Histiostoma feroniarum]